MRILPDFGRLGIGHLFRDHFKTLYRIDGNNNRKFSWSDFFIFAVLPAITSLALALLGVRIRGLAEIIGGMAILTALLFALLVHVFTMGLRVKDSPHYTASGEVAILVDELRANVSYACGISLILTTELVGAAALTKDVSRTGVSIWVSSIAAFLFLNLILTLFMIVNRVRTAYLKMAV